MLRATLIRIAAIGLVFSIFIFSAFMLTAERQADAKTSLETLRSDISETDILPEAEDADEVVVKLASLSIVTDVPIFEDTSLSLDPNMTTEERLTLARKLAGTQKFEEALHVLETSTRSEDNIYSVDYLKAQILSWSGNHARAEQAFLALQDQYPQDADIAVSFGYLHLYQKNFDDAERLFKQVLVRFPDYQDAQRGLERATAIE